MAKPNWRRIETAPPGIGDVLCRAGDGPSDPAYVARQQDDGRWLFEGVEVHPTHYCEIPLFDADDQESSS